MPCDEPQANHFLQKSVELNQRINEAADCTDPYEMDIKRVNAFRNHDEALEIRSRINTVQSLLGENTEAADFHDNGRIGKNCLQRTRKCNNYLMACIPNHTCQTAIPKN